MVNTCFLAILDRFYWRTPIMVEGRSRKAVSNMVLILGVASVMVIVFHNLNMGVLSLWRVKEGVDLSLSMHENLVFQGILLVLSGVIAFIGRIKEVREHCRPQMRARRYTILRSMVCPYS